MGQLKVSSLFPCYRYYNSSKSRTKIPDSSTMSWKQSYVLLLLIYTLYLSIHVCINLHPSLCSYSFHIYAPWSCWEHASGHKTRRGSVWQVWWTISRFQKSANSFLQKHICFLILGSHPKRPKVFYNTIKYWKKYEEIPEICTDALKVEATSNICHHLKLLYFYFWHLRLDSRQLKAEIISIYISISL